MKATAHRAHPAYWAFVVHRASGLALALFLPAHFFVLGLALERAEFDAAIGWTEQPLVKLAEWLLVTALAFHLTGGLRLLIVEMVAWNDAQKNWIALSAGVSVAVGLLFAFNAW